MSRAYQVKAEVTQGVTVFDFLETKKVAPFKEANKFSKQPYFEKKIEELWALINSGGTGTVELTSHTLESYVRGWQGGLANVVEDSSNNCYLVLNQRTPTAPVRPGVLDISAGRADDGKEEEERDWPEKMLKEGTEEVVMKVVGKVAGRQKRFIYVPTFEQAGYEKYAIGLAGKIWAEAERANIEFDGALKAPVELISPSLSATMRIHPYEDLTRTTLEVSGVGFAFEKDNSSIEWWMYAVRKLAGKLAYQDTECLPDGTYLNRNTVVISPKTGAFWIWNGGKVIERSRNIEDLIRYIEEVPAEKRGGRIANEKVLAAIKYWPPKLGSNRGLLPLLNYSAKSGN